MDLIFDVVECSDQDKRRMAVFQLTYAAADWWESERATLGEEGVRRLTWTTFKARFLEKYFSLTERNNKRKEFVEHVQGNWTVREYMTQFECLSSFMYNMISTPKARIQ